MQRGTFNSRRDIVVQTKTSLHFERGSFCGHLFLSSVEHQSDDRGLLATLRSREQPSIRTKSRSFSVHENFLLLPELYRTDTCSFLTCPRTLLTAGSVLLSYALGLLVLLLVVGKYLSYASRVFGNRSAWIP